MLSPSIRSRFMAGTATWLSAGRGVVVVTVSSRWLGRGRGGRLDPQVVAEHVFAGEFGGVAGEDDLAPAEDVDVVGDGQNLVHVLLDDEERDAFGADLVEEGEDLVDD